MSFGDPNNPYGAPQGPPPGGPQGQQPGYGYPQQQPAQPGYGYPQAPQGVPPQQGYGYPQAPQAPQGVPPQQGYGYQQQPPAGYGYGAQPRYANWGQRFAGTLLDGLIIGVVPYALMGIGAAVGKSAGMALVGIGYALLIGLAIWQLIREGRTGQTVGKKVMNIRLISENTGQPLGVGMAFVRRIAHFLDSIACYLGWLWPAWDAKRQTFADKVCSSIVIREN
jgi:uncharacterized RDD family membrane protein YckC